MHPVAALERWGGAASRAQLLQLSAPEELARLVRAGDVVRIARGRYALPWADQAVRAAARVSGVVSHLSAASYWGWEVKSAPEAPHVTVPRNRNLSRRQREGVVCHWSRLDPDDVHDGLVTDRRRTLIDCLTALPFDEALAVADSALRHDDVSAQALHRLAGERSGRGAARARGVAAAASPLAANPFESVLRAIASTVAGLRPIPQYAVREGTLVARVDLADPDRALILEADSHTWHASPAALQRDCERYNALAVRGWTVLRFTWQDVMLRPNEVHAVISLAVERAKVRHSGRRSV